MEFHVNLSLNPTAYQLVMEGLALLPLGRAKVLFELIEAEAKKQSEEFARSQRKPARSKPNQQPA